MRRSGEERRGGGGGKEKGVGAGERRSRRRREKKGGENERCVCSVPQADTSLLSLAQPNHMPPRPQGEGGRREGGGGER